MPVWCDIRLDGGMVDTNVLGAFVVRRIGSSPIWGTNKKFMNNHPQGVYIYSVFLLTVIFLIGMTPKKRHRK